jgi:maleamate amidohydrolase
MSDLEQSYAGDFRGHLSFGTRPALLVVDAVQGYIDPAAPIYAGVEHAIPVIAQLLDAARRARLPVIYTVVKYRADGADGGLFWKKLPALRAFVDGSPFATIPAAISPRPNELVLTKRYASAFFGTTLATDLASRRVDTLVIAGFSTSGCVRASALDALQHGYIPFVVQDACGDRYSVPHEANLFDLQAKYAEVVGADKVIELISQLSPSNQFYNHDRM